MARLNLIVESDDDDNDEFPDVSVLLANNNPSGKEKEILLERIQTLTKKKDDGKVMTALESRRRQRPLKLAHVNSLLLLPMVYKDVRLNGGGGFATDEETSGMGTWDPRGREIQSENRGRVEKVPDKIRKRSSPRKAAQISAARFHVPMDEDGSSEGNMSDFVVRDSESEVEAVPVRSPRRKAKEGFVRGSKTISSDQSVIDLLSPQANNRRETLPPGPSHENFDEDCRGRLRL